MKQMFGFGRSKTANSVKRIFVTGSLFRTSRIYFHEGQMLNVAKGINEKNILFHLTKVRNTNYYL